MGVIKFAFRMLGREKTKAFALGLSFVFVFITNLVFCEIVNNPFLRDDTISSSGMAMSQVSVPLSTLIAFAIILFSAFMLGFANNYFVSHKTGEMGIMALSGKSFLGITGYLFVQLFTIVLISLPLGLALGIGGVFLTNKIMYSYMGIHASIYAIPLRTYLDAGVYFGIIMLIILMLDSGYVYTHNISYLLHQEGQNDMAEVNGKQLPDFVYLGIAIFGVVMVITTPYSPSAYLFPCFFGSFGISGVMTHVIPHIIDKLKTSRWLDNKIKLIAMSNLSYSLKRSSMIVLTYCIAMIMMIALMISTKGTIREFITSVIAYGVVVMLLSVSIMYKYISEIQTRKILYFNLYKLGYVRKQLKRIILHELIGYFGLLIIMPMIYSAILLVLFHINGAAGYFFITALLLVEIVPVIVMPIMTYINYTKTALVLVEEGMRYE